jgi:hypothetical protein
VIREVASTDGFDEVLARINALGGASAEERQKFEKAFGPTIQILRKGNWFAQTLVKLAFIEQTSKLMIAAMRADQYESPGDVSYSGTNWKRWLSEGRVSKAQDAVSGIINAINEQIPAEVVKGTRETKASQ